MFHNIWFYFFMFFKILVPILDETVSQANKMSKIPLFDITWDSFG